MGESLESPNRVSAVPLPSATFTGVRTSKLLLQPSGSRLVPMVHLCQIWFRMPLCLVWIVLLASAANALAIEPHQQLQLEDPVLISNPNITVRSIGRTITYHSTHPAIEYFPKSDCVHRLFGKWCKGRNYAWKRYDYAADSLSTTRRSAAVVTNEHNNGYGNGPREVKFVLPSGK